MPFLAVFLLLTRAPVFAQTPEVGEARVLLFGDSWAGLMWEYRTYQQVFDKYGFADVGIDGELIGEGGTARSWSQPEALAALSTHISAHPALDTVVISLGGNDMLISWKTGMDRDQEDELLASVWQDLVHIIQTVLEVRPGIEVLLMGYDYTNFFETQSRDDSGRTARAWQQLGQPNAKQVNRLTVRLEKLKLEMARSDQRVHYVQAFGLMQYVFGYPKPPEFLGPGFAAYSVPFPGQANSGFDPFPGGDPAYPSPPEAMANDGADPIHLSREGYFAIATLQMETYFLPRFRGAPTLELQAETGNLSGWAATDGSFGSDSLVAGADGSALHYSAVVSFDSAPIHNRAKISRASLYLTREGECCGENPFNSDSFGPPQLELVSGSFGAPELQASDIDAPADVGDVARFYGSVRQAGNVLRVDLPAAALEAINKRGRTQLRISFPGSAVGEGVVRFYLSGESAPRLDVYYDRPRFSLVDLIDPDVRLGGIPLPLITLLSSICCFTVFAVLGGASLAARRRRR